MIEVKRTFLEKLFGFESQQIEIYDTESESEWILQKSGEAFELLS